METLAHSYMKLCLLGKLRILYAYMKLDTYWEKLFMLPEVLLRNETFC